MHRPEPRVAVLTVADEPQASGGSPGPRRRRGASAAEARLATQRFVAEVVRDRPAAWLTRGLVTLNLAWFVAMVIAGVDPYDPEREALIRWGALYGPATVAGESWRLLTSAFVHIGLLHLALNVAALAMCGWLVERLYGFFDLLCVYVSSAVGGSLASLALHPTATSAGASGAIFGLLGAMLGLLLRVPESFPMVVRRRLLRMTAFSIGLNLIAGFAIADVDNAAHIGGLLTGLLCSLVVAVPLAASASERRRGWARGALFIAGVGLATPAGLSWIEQRPELLASTRFDAGLLALDGAVADLQIALARDPTDPEIAGLLAAYLNDRGFARIARGDLATAARDFQAGAEVCGDADPKCRVGILENLGLIHLLRGDDREALQQTTVVNAIDADSAWNWLIRAIAADRCGDPATAREAIERWLGLRSPVDDRNLRTVLPVEYHVYLTGRLPDRTGS